MTCKRGVPLLSALALLLALGGHAAASLATPPAPAQAGAGNSAGTLVQQGAVRFTSAGGWLEYGFAEWQPVAGAAGYKAYYKREGAADAAWLPVDNELLRGTRLDLPGLLAGQPYLLKVAPLIGGAEAPAQASIARITAQALDRSGFAFDRRSPRGAAGTSGGYLPDGTVDPAARIVYLTEANKDSIELAVVKGRKGGVFTGLSAIAAGRTRARSSEPLIIRVIGTVTPQGDLLADRLKMLQFKDNSNITIEGIGTDAKLSGWGFDFQRCKNIEVRNLGFDMQPEDQLSFQSANLNVWVHNNDHYLGKGLPGTDADKLYGDGPLDVKRGTSWVSVDYNHYHETKKTNGVGFGKDTDALVLSYHHNFYERCNSRMPRISYVSMHVYNSYFKEAAGYAIGAAHGSSAFVQNNYFENSTRPIIIASQGHDLNGKRSTLSHNSGGAVKIQGNYMDAFSADPSRFTPEVDASEGPALKGGAVYNGFDARFGADYPQALDTPAVARDKVIKWAGRLKAGPAMSAP